MLHDASALACDLRDDGLGQLFIPGHVEAFTGVKTFTTTIPVDNETATDVFYRIHLRVTDSTGLDESDGITFFIDAAGTGACQND